MKLRSCLKRYKDDTHRALPPEETAARVESKMPAAGITRVADITNLDRIGIPVFSSIRPTAQNGAISVYNGKGATPTEARVSAMMEGIERCSAELGDRTEKLGLITGKFSELSKSQNVLNPVDLVLPPGTDPNSEVSWIMGYDLMNDEEMLVPANAVFHPWTVGNRLFRTNTNGLASGNEIEEAIFHGLSEVIERDAWSLVEMSRDTGPIIQGVGNGLAGELLEKFAKAEVAVYLRDITSDVGIPTCAAASEDLKLLDPALLTTGMGTHTCAGVAVLRALTEVAQSRLTQIHGAREDTSLAEFRKRMGYDRVKRMNKHWFETSQVEEFSQIKSYDSSDFLDDIKYMLSRLEEAGFQRAIVVNITREDLGVPVVRVIVPGLEMSAVDSDRFGKRSRAARVARDAKGRRVSGAKSA